MLRLVSRWRSYTNSQKFFGLIQDHVKCSVFMILYLNLQSANLNALYPSCSKAFKYDLELKTNTNVLCARELHCVEPHVK